MAKQRIQIGSAKAKGRALQNWTAIRVAKLLGYMTCGKDMPVAPREMGQSGTDVRIVDKADRQAFPFAIECKFQESWSVPQFVEQAKKNTEEDHLSWLLFMKRSRKNPVVVMDASVFFAIMRAIMDSDPFARSSFLNTREAVQSGHIRRLWSEVRKNVQDKSDQD